MIKAWPAKPGMIQIQTNRYRGIYVPVRLTNEINETALLVFDLLLFTLFVQLLK